MADKEAVLQTLKEVVDPELGRNLVELNLIRDINIDNEHVSIKMTLTTPFCPLANHLVQQVREHVAEIEGVDQVDVELVWN